MSVCPSVWPLGLCEAAVAFPQMLTPLRSPRLPCPSKQARPRNQVLISGSVRFGGARVDSCVREAAGVRLLLPRSRVWGSCSPKAALGRASRPVRNCLSSPSGHLWGQDSVLGRPTQLPRPAGRGAMQTCPPTCQRRLCEGLFLGLSRHHHNPNHTFPRSGGRSGPADGMSSGAAQALGDHRPCLLFPSQSTLDSLREAKKSPLPAFRYSTLHLLFLSAPSKWSLPGHGGTWRPD